MWYSPHLSLLVLLWTSAFLLELKEKERIWAVKRLILSQDKNYLYSTYVLLFVLINPPYFSSVPSSAGIICSSCKFHCLFFSAYTESRSYVCKYCKQIQLLKNKLLNMNAPLLIKKSTSVTADFCVMTFTAWSMGSPCMLTLRSFEDSDFPKSVYAIWKEQHVPDPF